MGAVDTNDSNSKKESFELETVWCKITTPNSEYHVASVYHPPVTIYETNDLLDFLSDSCDQILLDDPNANIIMACNINKLNIQKLVHQHCLHQLIKVPTRGDRILDIFLTNSPFL